MISSSHKTASSLPNVLRSALWLLIASLALACASELKSSIASAPQSSPTPSPSGTATVFWGNPNNPDIYGYNIYRSESDSGPFVKVNPEIIRPDHNKPNQTYTDHGLQNGRIYYYYIEAQHYAGGVKEKVTPITPVIVGKPWEKANDQK
jgi:hypothetical protein